MWDAAPGEPQGLGRLRGKAAVVTGAAAGIGKATAVLFARECALVVATDVVDAGLGRLWEELAAISSEVKTVDGVVSVDADARRMIQTAVDRFGRLVVLVAIA